MRRRSLYVSTANRRATVSTKRRSIAMASFVRKRMDRKGDRIPVILTVPWRRRTDSAGDAVAASYDRRGRGRDREAGRSAAGRARDAAARRVAGRGLPLQDPV